MRYPDWIGKESVSEELSDVIETYNIFCDNVGLERINVDNIDTVIDHYNTHGHKKLQELNLPVLNDGIAIWVGFPETKTGNFHAHLVDIFFHQFSDGAETIAK